MPVGIFYLFSLVLSEVYYIIPGVVTKTLTLPKNWLKVKTQKNTEKCLSEE